MISVAANWSSVMLHNRHLPPLRRVSYRKHHPHYIIVSRKLESTYSLSICMLTAIECRCPAHATCTAHALDGWYISTRMFAVLSHFCSRNTSSVNWNHRRPRSLRTVHGLQIQFRIPASTCCQHTASKATSAPNTIRLIGLQVSLCGGKPQAWSGQCSSQTLDPSSSPSQRQPEASPSHSMSPSSPTTSQADLNRPTAAMMYPATAPRTIRAADPHKIRAHRPHRPSIKRH